MFIPSDIYEKIIGSDALCPSKMAGSVFDKRSITSTADSFKSWDTCMDNRVCKIVAIVGIVLAALVVCWLVSSIVRCICCGAECLASIFCCCCSGRRPPPPQPMMMRSGPASNPYDNPNMYPPQYPQAARRDYAPVNPFEEKPYAVYETRAAGDSNQDYYNEYEMDHMNNRRSNLNHI